MTFLSAAPQGTRTVTTQCTTKVSDNQAQRIGKSSLINSLLGVKNLARTVSDLTSPKPGTYNKHAQSGMGTACTSVVMEYRLRRHLQTAKYTIEIERMTGDEINKQLRELLKSYQQYFLYDLDSKSFTADEQNRLEKQSKVA